MTSGGVYLHIPFCGKKCGYCDFYSLPAKQSLMDEYLAALLRDIQNHAGFDADTLYLGGGTPTLFGEVRLRTLMKAVGEAFPHITEATLEANPETVNPAFLIALREMGFNRISFGVQSFCEDELQALSRRHTAGRAEQAILDAKAAGLEHISADVMLAVPYQTKTSLMFTLDKLCRLPVNHVSAYLLQLEEGTPLAAQNPTLPNEEETTELYLTAVEMLEHAGLHQYEISNFGTPCRHNLHYWQGDPYLGLGAAAHGCVGGKRLAYPPDIHYYIKGGQPQVIDSAGDFAETAMLRLRLNKGLNLTECKARWKIDTHAITKAILPYSKAGLLEICGDMLRLTPRGFLVSNRLIGEIITAGGWDI